MWWTQHAVDRVVRQIEAWLAGVIEAIDVWRRREALERQLRSLDDRSMLDIGLLRDQIPDLVRAYPEAPRLLRRMMEHLGVARTLAAKEVHLQRELERNCVVCISRSQCRRWLGSGRPAQAYRSFCPNAAKLDEIRELQAVSG
jgi:uncharacterized protein YjiS (DUF1127 family)